MKKFLTPAALLLSMLMALSLTSCDDDDWGPDRGPEPGPNGFYDSDLLGTWVLYQANGQPVTGYDVNYIQFSRQGRGWYYYYDRGRQYEEQISWWCQYASPSSPNDYSVNIRYANGSLSTVSYWFTSSAIGDMLWLSWYTSSAGTVTYVYREVSSLPDW